MADQGGLACHRTVAAAPPKVRPSPYPPCRVS
jgi:hypothetical protein